MDLILCNGEACYMWRSCKRDLKIGQCWLKATLTVVGKQERGIKLSLGDACEWKSKSFQWWDQEDVKYWKEKGDLFEKAFAKIWRWGKQEWSWREGALRLMKSTICLFVCWFMWNTYFHLDIGLCFPQIIQGKIFFNRNWNRIIFFKKYTHF